MKTKTPVKLLVLSLFFALSGCQGSQDTSEAAGSPKSITEKAAPTLIVGEVNKSQAEDVKSQAFLAINELAYRLNVLSDEIQAIRTENVTWRDGSLGCPQEGMMYTQALVPGALIVLGSGAVEYEYHSGGSRGPFYCENPQSPAPATSAE